MHLFFVTKKMMDQYNQLPFHEPFTSSRLHPHGVLFSACCNFWLELLFSSKMAELESVRSLHDRLTEEAAEDSQLTEKQGTGRAGAS